MTTIKSALPLDAEFILSRIIECIAICDLQVKRSLDNEHLFHKAFDQAQRWLNHYTSAASPYKAAHVQSLLEDLNVRFLNIKSLLDLDDDLLEEVQAHNEKNQPVPEPAPPAQLSVFRVLGQASAEKYISFYTLNEFEGYKQVASRFAPHWRPTLTLTKRLLSNTRPVGGLEQCQ